MITNAQSGTTVDEIEEGVFRIHTPVRDVLGGFSFNQYLVAADEPLLFHTGPKSMFALVREAIEAVTPVSRLRYIAHSHFESDECGSINDLLAAAPHATAVCSAINGMINGDTYLRPPRALADGESLRLGSREVKWFETPHLPHAWECGYLFETITRTLLCGDLFTQRGADHPALVESDILGPSEQFRKELDYYAHAPNSRALLERLAESAPRTLACMHGSAWRGDAPALLRALADSIERG